MQSQFNTEFNKILAESDAGAVYGNKQTTNSTNVSAVSANTTETSAMSANPHEGALASLRQSLPSIMKTLDAQHKLWTGKANIGLNELAEMIRGYNEKQALNALYGIIDYMKSKQPVLMMQDNDMIKTIKQQLLQKQNEKQQI